MALSKPEKEKILESATSFFTERIALRHKARIIKLANPKSFKINPFLQVYLAKLLCGETNPESMAKSLILARALSPSITTICGREMQHFCTAVLQGYGSSTTGLDIEFVDELDGHKKYCQLKLGPNCLNKGDIEPLASKFQTILATARGNNLRLATDDLIVGVAYGTPKELSNNYKNLTRKYNIPVFVGSEFWHRLTGDIKFYDDLIAAFGRAAEKADTVGLIDETVELLAARLA